MDHALVAIIRLLGLAGRNDRRTAALALDGQTESDENDRSRQMMMDRRSL